MRHAIYAGIAVLFAGFSLGAGPAMADMYNAGPPDQLLTTHSCPGCFMNGANLSDLNLQNADLRGAHMNDATLAGLDLSGANLSGVNLSGATWTDGRQCAQGSVGQCN